jgi:hypothetical protein
MKTMSLRSGLPAMLLAVAAVSSLPVVAADLSYPPQGSAYEDPRYGDIYNLPPPAPRQAAPYYPSYEQSYRPPYRDERGYLREMQPPYAYDYRAPAPKYGQQYSQPYGQQRYGEGCAPRDVIRADLERQGWWDFQDLERRGDVVIVRARRGNGRWFDLTVDRCSGQLLEARLTARRAAEADPDDWRYRAAPPRY